MGVGQSTPETQLTQEQQDVKYLGERMPFGDEELRQVYRSYQAMKAKLPEERISFFTDIGVHSVPLENQDERMVLLQAVEQQFLPPNLGNRLYETAFVKSQQHSEYNAGNCFHDPTSVPPTDDNYTRIVKLEAFFEGLAQCSRRGNAKALKVLFQCCQPQTTTEGVLVDPLELVTIGYRVGLASGFLSAVDKEGSEDISQLIPDKDNDHDNDHDEASKNQNPSNLGLKALAESLVDFCNRKKQRFNPNAPSTKFVSEDEVQEWAEQVAPMLGSGLATFTHKLFFPDRPYPPTRTNFEYPTLAEFSSTVISKANSSLLFSYACMSPALGGEVRRTSTLLLLLSVSNSCFRHCSTTSSSYPRLQSL